MQRRSLLKALASGAIMLHSPTLFASNKVVNKKSLKRVVWILQRGAVDSLHTIIPTFEKNLTSLRPDLMTGLENAFPLDSQFNLHPSLFNIHGLYMRKELSCVVATSTGYKGRSHFDGQDHLESGLENARLESGWLGRAMDTLGSEGIAISKTQPLAFRNSPRGSNFYPSNFNNSIDGLTDDLAALYQYDEKLTKTLNSGIEIKNTLISDGKKHPQVSFSKLCGECADIMKSKPNIQFVMLESGGWDTHKAQNVRLSRELRELDSGIAQLKYGLGKDWKNTLVLVTSEFGRTVRQNGTQGTDHGTAGCIFIAGGSHLGGAILGTWPGLSDAALFEKRDLFPTSNTLSWVSTAIKQHIGLNSTQIKAIFPDHSPYNNKLFNDEKKPLP
ncbi:hypothetical protein KUL152_32310 [Tenacibaculum sp. KUL152]|nr:hypothetical protein KUL152_32310 [Tenacibaculum sp. KUL152]GFD94566.1 hypothetical protein KUL154_32990 [Alteromonas sp. KUL154]GFD97579.1 hypothetical protein KUL156_01720 [Alteromonas sp. KUL156]